MGEHTKYTGIDAFDAWNNISGIGIHVGKVGILFHAPSQWETTLKCNTISHWLGAAHTQNDPW